MLPNGYYILIKLVGNNWCYWGKEDVCIWAWWHMLVVLALKVGRVKV